MLLTGLEEVLSMPPSQLKEARPPAVGAFCAPSATYGASASAAPNPRAEGAGEQLPSQLDPTDWEEEAFPSQPQEEVVAMSEAKINNVNGAYYAVVSRDRLTAKYVGKANHGQDVGTVKADRPLPTRQAYYYFEVTVVEGSESSCSVSVGLAAKGFPLNRMPGHAPDSYGYRGLDGRVVCHGASLPRGREYGTAFGKGDVVGCGVDFARQEVFFTKNGRTLGTAFRGIFGGGGGDETQQGGRQEQQQQASSSSRGSGHGRSSSSSILLSRSRAASAASAGEMALLNRFMATGMLTASQIARLRPGPTVAEAGPMAARRGGEGEGGGRQGVASAARGGRKLDELYPVIGMHAPGEVIKVNFGAEPFCFDLSSQRAADEGRLKASLRRMPVQASHVQSVVRDYLLTMGYADTLKHYGVVDPSHHPAAASGEGAKQMEVEAEMRGDRGERRRRREAANGQQAMAVVPSGGDEGGQQAEPEQRRADEGKQEGGAGAGSEERLRGMAAFEALVRRREAPLRSSLDARSAVMQAVLMGRGAEAMQRLSSAPYQGFLEARPGLRFELQCLEFAQLVKARQLEAALDYARTELLPYACRPPAAEEEEEEGQEGPSPMEVVDSIASSSAMNGRGGGGEKRAHWGTMRDDEGGVREQGGGAPAAAAVGGPAAKAKTTGPGAVVAATAYALRLRELMGLLAYKDPEQSPLGHLLSRDHFEQVAQLVNKEMLEVSFGGDRDGGAETGSSSSYPRTSLLEVAVTQLLAVQEGMREHVAGGRGEAFVLPLSEE